MVKYILTHEHIYGASTYMFTSNKYDLANVFCQGKQLLPQDKIIIGLLEIDFEPERSETITIKLLETEDIQHIHF